MHTRYASFSPRPDQARRRDDILTTTAKRSRDDL